MLNIFLNVYRSAGPNSKSSTFCHSTYACSHPVRISDNVTWLGDAVKDCAFTLRSSIFVLKISYDGMIMLSAQCMRISFLSFELSSVDGSPPSLPQAHNKVVR